MIISEEETTHFLFRVIFITFLIIVAGSLVIGDSLDTDKQVLLQLKSFLENENPIISNRGLYKEWNPNDTSPCNWPGISCSNNTNRVAEIRLSNCNIAGGIFPNFSALPELRHLDLSGNTLGGFVPDDLSRCYNLKFLNLSHNIILGEVNLTGLGKLEVLDLSINRIRVDVRLTIPINCDNLAVANISSNNITGGVGRIFENCSNLRFLDLSTNVALGGDLWHGFHRLEEFSISESNFSGEIPKSIFDSGCRLRVLDLSDNRFYGEFPAEISNCRNLEVLRLSGNGFSGQIPKEIGLLRNLSTLMLGDNNFSRDVPESLVGLEKLNFLDLSKNEFGGDIQPIFGRFSQVKFLLLHRNSYTGGIYTSGIHELRNLSRLDLSFNEFSGPLPVEISRMGSLKFLILAYNKFTGPIPFEYGNLKGLNALDLSFNKLNSSIPPSLGNLTSLLWLMLANNSLTGEIPPEIGNCSSLLWLNLANNQLSGAIPYELARIGTNVTPTFMFNRQNDHMTAGSGECLAMKRWIPADYPPFSFVYNLLNRKSCRNIWDKLVKGYGLFQVCSPGSNIRTYQITGYLQLSGNRLSGEIPIQIGEMLNFSMFHLGYNRFSGELPKEIGQLPLVVLNVSRNEFYGEIPTQIGDIKCLQNLDLSYNNFSGVFPSSVNDLSSLNQFNLSYNPYISGVIPKIGQLATFDRSSFLGDPLLRLPPFIDNSTKASSGSEDMGYHKRAQRPSPILMVVVLMFIFIVFGLMTLIVCVVSKNPKDERQYPPENQKGRPVFGSSSGSSSPWLSNAVKVIRLDKTSFTHHDILKATSSFSEERIIGVGGSGIVYRGVLPDGRKVAVKKLQSEGVEGEREFRAEMEALSGNGYGWEHPNLVKLYGWCLDGSKKLLVYEYMEGGSLEDLITDQVTLNWTRRLEISIDISHALVFLHHECFPSILHRDVKASNVLLDKNGGARITDFGLSRVVDIGFSHVSTMVAGTIGYVAPEYGQTWQATTKGDVYSFGVLAMELATGRRAIDSGEECLTEWAKRVVEGEKIVPVDLLVSGREDGAGPMGELLRVGIRCTAESPSARPNMKEVLAMLVKIYCNVRDSSDVRLGL